MQHYTTIEQSKKLLELGLNPKSTDMGYLWNGCVFSEYPASKQTIFKKVGNIPCWSLGALFEVMPEIDNQLPSLRKYKNYYCVVYSDNVTRLGDNQWQNGKTPTEAAYNMVVWLIENGYINKGE
jgi:hypothetical protein